MAKKKNPYIHYAIAIVLGLLIALLLQPTAIEAVEATETTAAVEAVPGLTRIGINVLAITVATLYLWLTCNTHWTSLLFMGMLVMTGAMTGNEVWAGSMGHFSVITMIVFMMLNYCLMQTGVINLVCTWFITRKVVKNRPYVFLGMFFASMMIIGLFVDNLSLAVIYVGIAEVLCSKLKIEKGEALYTCMFIGIMWVDDIISIASPIAHAPCLILMNFMKGLENPINVSYGQWLALGIPFALLMLVVIMITVKIWKPDTQKYVNYNVDAERANMPKLDTKGKIAVGIFVLAVLMMILPEVFAVAGILPGFAAYWKKCGVIVVGILAVSLLSMVRVKGEPILDAPSALKSLPMGAIIFAGVVCVMSTPISAANTGIRPWLTGVLTPIVANMSPVVIMIVMAVAALIMTNFLSNVVTMTIFFYLGTSLLAGSSINLGVFSMIIGIMSALACVTPSACAPMPLVFGPGHVTMKNTIKANLIFVALAFVVTLAYIIPVAPMIIG